VSVRALVGAVAFALLAAACGSGSTTKATALDETCKRETAALARVGPIRDLGDATRALRSVLALERRTLVDVDATGKDGERLAARLRVSIGATQRSLRAIVGADPQQTMTPVRTGVSNARRSAADAAALLRSFCGGAKP
jgi:hypothetical protein